MIKILKFKALLEVITANTLYVPDLIDPLNFSIKEVVDQSWTCVFLWLFTNQFDCLEGVFGWVDSTDLKDDRNQFGTAIIKDEVVFAEKVNIYTYAFC